MLTEIVSPPVEDLGPVSSSMLAELAEIASQLTEDKHRVGQMATQVIIGEHTDHPLHDFAIAVGRQFLGERPGDGSDVRLKYVTDADAFLKDPQRLGAATYWHHDYDLTKKRGFSLLDTRRIVIPTQRGTWSAVGTLGFEDARIVGPAEALALGRRALLKTGGPTVIGEGGVLIKSETDPLGGIISQTAPDRAYIIPRNTAHKADKDLPTRRILFRMDAKLN